MHSVSYKTLAQAILLVCYPLSCHFAVTLDQPQLQLLALLFLSVGIILRGLLENSWLSWGVITLLLAAGLLINVLGIQRYILYLPPVVLPLMLWSIFQRSLQSGRTPLITSIAREVRGSLSEELRNYTRRVTTTWSWLFLALSVGSALLPFVASPVVWSLFTNFLNYLFIVLLFVFEFIYRQWRFSELEHKSFYQYLQSIARVDIRQFR